MHVVLLKVTRGQEDELSKFEDHLLPPNLSSVDIVSVDLGEVKAASALVSKSKVSALKHSVIANAMQAMGLMDLEDDKKSKCDKLEWAHYFF